MRFMDLLGYGFFVGMGILIGWGLGDQIQQFFEAVIGLMK